MLLLKLMALKMTFIFFIFMNSLALRITKAQQTPPQYTKLVHQWPKTTCMAIGCGISPIPYRFTIHGLWPSFYPYAPRENCDLSQPWLQFPQADLTALTFYWPSFGMSNNDFWRHEWYKHGTCSIYNHHQFQYFHSTIVLSQNLDITSIFSRANIMPGGSYDLAMLLVTLSNSVPGGTRVVQISCFADGTGYYLKEITHCLDDNAQNYVDCPCPVASTCGVTIMIPY